MKSVNDSRTNCKVIDQLTSIVRNTGCKIISHLNFITSLTDVQPLIRGLGKRFSDESVGVIRKRNKNVSASM